MPDNINGNINIDWSFDHTGGLALTMVRISYVFQEVMGINQTRNGPAVTFGDRRATISTLTAGFSYIPVVTATNVVGSARAECPSVKLNFGETYSLFGGS